MQSSKVSLSPGDKSLTLPNEDGLRSAGPTIYPSSNERVVPVGDWILPFAVLGTFVWFLVIRTLWAWVG